MVQHSPTPILDLLVHFLSAVKLVQQQHTFRCWTKCTCWTDSLFVYSVEKWILHLYTTIEVTAFQSVVRCLRLARATGIFWSGL